jgi:hypothetical protein
MELDNRAFDALIEESRDQHSDAMRDTRTALDEMVEVAHDRPAGSDESDDGELARNRRDLLSRGVLGGKALAATGLGAGLLAVMARPAFADQSADVQMLQTAASIENLAIATYDAALGLPFASSLPKVVQTFATTTKSQHTYLAAIGGISSSAGIKTAASIEPVELQHAAILNFMLGNYPVPDAFTKTDGARTTSDKIG